MSGYFREYFATGTLQGTYSQTYPQQIRAFPIRIIPFESHGMRRHEKEEIERISDTLLGCKNLLDVTSTLEKESIKTTENGIVNLHDILNNLGKNITEMNKKRHNEIQGFLSWLETELQASIEDLANKTQTKEYYKLTYDELLGIIKKNAKNLPINPSDRFFQENLKREYEKSMNVLTPLFEKIEKVDWLIDQIVYKLYGLTEEEIRIVEDSIDSPCGQYYL